MRRAIKLCLPRIGRTLLIVCWSWAAVQRAVAAEPSAADVEWFEKQIRPVLIAHCQECHGPRKSHGNLRLDSVEAALRGGDSGPVLVPGQPDESRLIQAVRREGDFEMPPDERLPDETVRLLEEWVRRGAPGPRAVETAPTDELLARGRAWWSYQPISDPALPATRDGAARRPIDCFVDARLDQAGLSAQPRAAGTVLVRRLYFDLWGLPPEPEALTALDDPSPETYARLVDALLASPRFGERFARHWLDVARFAESMTLRGFILPDAWRYRDYVIASLNDDRPYDEFLREQIAGDLVPSASLAERQRRLVATTFLALGNHNLEEQEKPQLDMDVVDEQLDVIGKAILGQTIGCARCHDHKFDPIPTRDYYALAGILRNVQVLEHANVSQGVTVNFPLPEEDERVLAEHETQLADAEAQVAGARARIEQLVQATTGGKPRDGVVAAGDLPGIVVDDRDAAKVGDWRASRHTKPYIGDGYVHDDDQGKGEKTLTFTPALPTSDVYEVRLAYTAGGNRASHVPVTVFSAEGERTVYVDMRQKPPMDGSFVSLGKHRFELGGQCFVLLTNEATTGHVVADAVQFLPQQALATTTNAVGATETAPESAELAEERQRLKSLEAAAQALRKNGPRRPKVLSVVEREDVRDLPIHRRGSVRALGEVVPRGFLQAVAVESPALPADQSGRRELADWLASPDNPLTARVLVNRVWQWLLGEGLVRTPDNFGTTGEPPTHPELLDHLARRFVASGWSIKQLVREIVLSDVYQRSSADHDEQQASVDPENRLLARAHRRPLEAECLRDAMLSIGGQLASTGGGSTLRPGEKTDYGYEIGGTQRSVYLPVLRNALPPLLEVFDFPHPSLVVGRRNRSHVVSQSLLMLNDPFVREQAVAAALRLLAEMPGSHDARIERAFLQTVGRAPLDAEWTLAREIVGHADSPEPVAEAWADLYHALFCSSDFRYRD